MPRQADLAAGLAAAGVDQAQRAVAVAGQHRARGGVVAQVVRIRQPPDARKHGKRARIEHVDAARAAFGDEEPVRLRRKRQPLRLGEAAQAPFIAPAREIDHLERAVAKRRDEQAPARGIEREMVDAARDVRHRDRRDELERRARVREPAARAEREDGERTPHHRQACGFQVWTSSCPSLHQA